MPYSILIIEDNTDIAAGLAHNLQFEGFKTATAHSGETGLAHLRQARFDLVILDLMLPGKSGFEVLGQMRKTGIDTPVLVLSALGQETDKVRGFRLGADDYMVKPFGLLELVARIQAILKRTGAIAKTDNLVQVGVLCLDDGSKIARVNGQALSLTPKEYELLRILMLSTGTVLSREHLLETVWAHKTSVTTRTVDTHIAELRKKINNLCPDNQQIHTHPKMGYSLS